MSSKKILLTVDLEDWFQVENLRAHFPHAVWSECEPRIHDSVNALLELFHNHKIKATFFVLGWLAERYPDLVQKISSHGHEIASHGYSHKLCTDLSVQELRDDLLSSKQLLEDITGKPVVGYRAPSFSVTPELITLLSDTGYAYDSSYNSFGMNSRYGKLPGAWRTLAKGICQAENGIMELPISNLEVAGRTLPWGGGGFFRLYPFSLFKKGVEHILSKKHFYMFYCHPWEFDPGQPRVKALRADYRFRHYVNIGRNMQKLDAFLAYFSDCSFMTCGAYI
jgi:polysaccharide deacetylase family protein (PEP-CTERM system associated)